MDESHTAHRIAQWQAENRVVHEILIGTIVRFDPVAEALSIVRQAAEDVRAVDAGGAGRRPHDAQIATVEDAQEACAASLVRRLRCYVGGDLILALARWETSNHGATGDWIIRARNLVDDFANIATGRRGGDRALLARFTVAVRVSAAEIGNRIYVLGEGQNRRVIDSACPDVVVAWQSSHSVGTVLRGELGSFTVTRAAAEAGRELTSATPASISGIDHIGADEAARYRAWAGALKFGRSMDDVGAAFREWQALRQASPSITADSGATPDLALKIAE